MLKRDYYTDRRIDPLLLIQDVASVIERLRSHPTGQSSVYARYAWPAGAEISGSELWRYRFRLRGQHGGPAQGRLMYVFYPADRRIRLLWAYNHDQYSKRPDDALIRKALADF